MTQLDLAEARAAAGPEWLPASGALFVFYDEQRADSADRLKVLYSPRRGEVAQLPPAPLRPEYQFGSRRVRFSPATSAPSLDWLDLEPRLADEVEDLYESYEPDHRLGGYPDEIQPASFPTDCEALARRTFPDLHDAPRPASDPGATDWRLLLQIDADDELGMVWIDMGRLFVFVREEDARAGDCSRTVGFSQFY